MAGVSWIKISTSMFEDEKIDFIQQLPEGDALLVVWVRLLTMAGRCNAGGYIMLTESIPYTDEMLAARFRKPLNIVKMAMQTFDRLGMVTMSDNGIYIANWEKHQNIDALEKIREQTRKRVAKHREVKQVAGNVTVTDDVTHGNATDIEEELELEEEKTNNTPHIKIQHLTITKSEHAKLTEQFGEIAVNRIYESMANYGKLRQYKSGYLTAKKWLERDKPVGNLTPTDSYDDAELILRRMQKAAAGKGRE